MVEIKEERLKEELEQASISLVLDRYSDIFSDFDPMPKNLRNVNDELKIKKRLREHFRKHHAEKEKAIKKVKKDGIVWVSLGVLILIGVVYGLVNVSNTFFEALITIMEIPSWFLVWEGMRKILIDSKEKEPDAVFYHKMSNASINFISY
jgi:hypothetical protein